tara:strand:+ start:605 stop:811 length:207 start_codon:yes stop_codon:yes gene_type:complete
MTKENKPSGRKWDGISRVSNDLYRENFNKIFGKSSTKKKERKDDRGPNDLERVIDTLKEKIKKLENET